MGWTDERADLVKKLWHEGLSAGQIAKQIGGTTRNAVIGKIHRLGLSGRTPCPAPRMPAPPRAPSLSAQPPSAPRPFAVAAGAEAGVFEFTPRHSSSSRVCSWPIGHPSDDDFRFCGRSVARGPYCAEHAQVAFQPGGGKSAVRELERSLRRYL